MHQLIPNTYTICESPEQCKELFEWAKANGIACESIGWLDEHGGDTMLLFDSDLWCFKIGYTPAREKFIPLPEFISRLKGEYEEGFNLSLTKEQYNVLKKSLRHVIAYNCLTNKEAGQLALISEQLNKQP